MAGFFDQLSAGFGGSDNLLAASNALLQAGAPSRTPVGFGQALGMAGQSVVDAKKKQQQEAMQKMLLDLQLQQHQLQAKKANRDMASEDALASLARQFQRPGSPGMPANEMDSGMDMGQQPGTLDRAGFANAYEVMDPIKGLAYQQSLAKDKPKFGTAAAGSSIFNEATGQVVGSTPDKPEKDPEQIRALKLIYGDGTPAYLKAVQALGSKMTTHAPAPSASATVYAEKPLINAVAGGLGKQIDDSLGAARAAIPAINNAQKLMAAVDSGKIVSGPGASFRVAGLQIGQLLGVGGKDGAEILSNTRTAIQAMAQAELDAAQQMKGQGQITEAERGIIKRAASGDIDSLTAPEIKLLAQTIEKAARYKIKAHKNNFSAMKNMENMAPLMPFYDVAEPAAYAPPANGQFRVLGKE